eukprot:UN00296
MKHLSSTNQRHLLKLRSKTQNCYLCKRVEKLRGNHLF